ncbi:hypothetical protein GQ44DRAFT_497942 [Phaeosphaeriaceae sp. PMI808]|nr:hypothetical protein GQ44DRAFT_497942 [Phaeosphaeriaceae sp. PMI808]
MQPAARGDGYSDVAQHRAYADGARNFPTPTTKTSTQTRRCFIMVKIKYFCRPTTDRTGQPRGLRNADKQLRIYLTDPRMLWWGFLTYAWGQVCLDSMLATIIKNKNISTIKPRPSVSEFLQWDHWLATHHLV